VGLSSDGQAALLTGGLGDLITHVSLHTGNPGGTGANEVAGAPYSRQPVSWTAAANGQRANDAVINFDVPSGTTALWVGYWSALNGGTFYGCSPVNGNLWGSGVAKASDNTITSYDHGLEVGDRIVVSAIAAGVLPGGMSSGDLFWVVDAPSTATFKVSTVEGGAVFDITANSELFFQKVLPEFFSSIGTLSFQAGDLVIDARAL